MAIVLKAFDYTKKFDLLPRFAQLEPDDLNLVKQTLEASIPSQEHTVTILQRLLNLPRIPDQQINLNECINTAGKSTSIFRQQVTTGATAMYKTLEVLWPKLYPPQAPPQLLLNLPCTALRHAGLSSISKSQLEILDAQASPDYQNDE